MIKKIFHRILEVSFRKHLYRFYKIRNLLKYRCLEAKLTKLLRLRVESFTGKGGKNYGFFTKDLREKGVKVETFTG
jgi:hypothetical protein